MHTHFFSLLIQKVKMEYSAGKVSVTATTLSLGSGLGFKATVEYFMLMEASGSRNFSSSNAGLIRLRTKRIRQRK